ncbi:MAG: fumarate hydratase [Chloroflexi bacterium RBG_16_50_9]|nr:MAG: fumarate hydratase [Chloroflexi bacterium RBG_16_50_9]
MPMKIKLPLTEETVRELRAGDEVTLYGVLYVARDAAHKRMADALDQGKPLPFNITGQTIYYMAPSPARPGQVVGAAGPTTSSRMDRYTSRLLSEGLKGMIGKGSRSQDVKKAIIKYGAIYLGVVGGTGALISKNIVSAEVVAYEDLGPEAILRLEVADFTATVINDIYGGDFYEQGQRAYRKAR